MGQNIAMLTGGIDLSVGPLAGFLVVVASFFVWTTQSPGRVVLGLIVMAAAAALVGAVNGSLIRFGRFTPIAATLTLYIALGGLAFLLRDTQGGYISLAFQNAVNYRWGPIPVAFVVFLIIAVVMEFALRRRPWGWRLRAVGSDEDCARRIGINVTRTVVLALRRLVAVRVPRRADVHGPVRHRRPCSGCGVTRSPASPRSCSAAPACSAAGARSSAPWWARCCCSRC